MPMLCAEQLCLRALSELDQLEADYMACMGSRDPEAVAVATRLFGSHLLMTLGQLTTAMLISRSEAALTTAPMSTPMSTQP